MKKLTFAFMCAALLAACTKENLETGSTQSAVEVTLSAVAEQQVDENATKTGLGSGNTIVWKSGDKLSVLSNISSTSNNDEFTLTTGAEAVSGTFNGTLTEGADQYYALYPYSSEASYDGTKISFKLPQNQTYAAGSFGNGANPSVAAFTDPASSLSFKNICGVFKLSLTGSVTVEKIALCDDSGKMIWGDASLTADANIGTDSQTLTLADGNNTIWLSGISATLTSTATNFYFVAPKGAFASGFTAYILGTDGKIYTYLSSAKSNTVARSRIMAMPTAAVAAPASKDLGGNSNCFVVPCAGTYTFTANQGKGGSAVTPATVEVLWETVNTNAAPSVGSVINNVSVSGSTISFTATGTAGNALIAAKDGSDNIVWSWHIWSTAAPVAVKAYSTGGGKWMDRNLGALANDFTTLANGLFYQWGRKDPLLGAISTDNMIITSTGVIIVQDFITDGTATIQYATQNPTHFISNASDYSSANSWLSDINNLDGLWSDPNKTQYDPCPYGYVVPDKDKFPNQQYGNGGAFIYDNTEKFPCNGWLGRDPLTCSCSGTNLFLSNLYTSKNAYSFYSTRPSEGFPTKTGRGVRCVKEE